MIALLKKHRQSIMGFAAIMILIYHCCESIFTEKEGLLYTAEHFILRNGYAGVDILFLLSGFGLVYSVNNNTIGDYYKHRIKRLFVPVLLISVVYLFFYRWSIEEYILNILGINFYISNIYRFLWFVYAIVTIYLLFPLYYRLYSKTTNKRLTFFISLIVWFIFTKLFENNIRNDIFGFTNRIPIFLTGVYFGQMSKDGRDFKINRYIFISVCFIGLLFGLYELHLCNDYNHYILVNSSNCCVPTYAVAVFGSFILARIFEKSNVISKLFHWIGSFSLELYCCQEIMVEMTGNPFNTIIRYPLIKNVLLFILIILISYYYKKVCDFLKK